MARNAPGSLQNLPILDNEPFYPNFPRHPLDIAVDPVPPPVKGLNRPISRNEIQNAQLMRDIVTAKKMGAYDLLVGQHQVNAEGVRVGINVPDFQFTLQNKQRVYVEYDTPISLRALPHIKHLYANDPIGIVLLKTVPKGE